MILIVFLRGINVGGRAIKMADLRVAFEKAGYRNVKTILQSGNVILETSIADIGKNEEDIESLLQEQFSYPARVACVSPGQLTEICSGYPFDADDSHHKYIIFTKNGFEKKLIEEKPQLDAEIEKVKFGNGVAYWMITKGLTLDSPFAKYIAKVSAKHFVTTRNLNTLEKILKKVE